MKTIFMINNGEIMELEKDIDFKLFEEIDFVGTTYILTTIEVSHDTKRLIFEDKYKYIMKQVKYR